MIKKLLFVILILYSVSCVSMKKFSSTQIQLSDLRKDSALMANVTAEQSARIDELLRRNISLGRDTLRLFSDFMALLEKHERTTEESRLEIVRLNSQLYGSSKRVNSARGNDRVSKIAVALNNSMIALGEEMRLTLRNENRDLYNIENRNWELVITLRDPLLFRSYTDSGVTVLDYNQLSKSGEILINKIASMIVEKDNFDVIVREYVSFNSPSLRFIPSIKTIESGSGKISDTMNSFLTQSQSVDDLVESNTLMDTAQGRLLDSMKQAREMERFRRKESDRLAELSKHRDRDRRKATDLSSVIIRNIVRSCFSNIGSSKISKDISYVKVGSGSQTSDNEWIEIVLKPNIEELYNIVLKETENRK